MDVVHEDPAKGSYQGFLEHVDAEAGDAEEVRGVEEVVANVDEWVGWEGEAGCFDECSLR